MLHSARTTLSIESCGSTRPALRHSWISLCLHRCKHLWCPEAPPDLCHQPICPKASTRYPDMPKPHEWKSKWFDLPNLGLVSGSPTHSYHPSSALGCFGSVLQLDGSGMYYRESAGFEFPAFHSHSSVAAWPFVAAWPSSSDKRCKTHRDQYCKRFLEGKQGKTEPIQQGYTKFECICFHLIFVSWRILLEPALYNTWTRETIHPKLYRN